VRTEISDAPPDANGVEDFCNSGLPYSTYCDQGQVRLMAVKEAEALGPCIARYFASKLWGGEEFFVQIDSHIWFVEGWDSKLVHSMRIAPSKKPVISTYPPGYGGKWENKPGPRMCGASFSASPVEARIIRLGGSQTSTQLPAPEGEPIPSPYVAAGFFAAPSDFLKDLPFDPFLPWVFMGEEIMLSSRFFTNGYDIFAPRENILAHE
jgi:[Skp1-protein]-hydroxyproline N-acetylglucosaminyltransferase